jgi:exodeoxyribonuclease V alpha subunit
MQIRNNYEVDIYNGDIGIVDYVDKDGNVGIIFSDSDDVLEYTKDEATDQLVLCYAQSVHKSQGAEYDTVVVVMTSSHYAMLFRNLLYTAVTRASKNLYLVGDRKAFAMAASNTRDNNRMTGLKGL